MMVFSFVAPAGSSSARVGQAETHSGVPPFSSVHQSQ